MSTPIRLEVLCADGRPGAKPWLSVRHCLRLMPEGFFSAARVFSPTPPPAAEIDGFPISWRHWETIDIHDYSRFCMKDLADAVEGTHALIVQNDGYILHPELWNPRWLEYDYIGAPWPLVTAGGDRRKRVGNGGFSLRSTALLRACQKLDFREGVPEDIQICQTGRHVFVLQGLVFAPIESARRFSVERVPTGSPTFGFHGATGRDGRVLLDDQNV